MTTEIDAEGLDPAYTDGPFFVIPMPVNKHGSGPEMDPAKVLQTSYEVWNGHNLSLGSYPSKALAQFVADALNATALQSQAEAHAEARAAEDAAKDAFWAVYPTYIEVKGHGISEEAAHTELSARATTAEASLATMREALEHIVQWSEAYPIAAFPEPDFAKVRELLAAGGIEVGAVSASNMRHVVTEVGAIARRALGGSNAE